VGSRPRLYQRLCALKPGGPDDPLLRAGATKGGAVCGVSRRFQYGRKVHSSLAKTPPPLNFPDLLAPHLWKQTFARHPPQNLRRRLPPPPLWIPRLPRCPVTHPVRASLLLLGFRAAITMPGRLQPWPESPQSRQGVWRVFRISPDSRDAVVFLGSRAAAPHDSPTRRRTARLRRRAKFGAARRF